MNNQNLTITDINRSVVGEIAIAKVMDRGIIVIPNQIRQKAGLNKGLYVEVTIRNNEVIITPLASRLQDTKGVFLKGLEIIPAEYSKEEGLQILAKTRGILADKDYKLWQKQRQEQRKEEKRRLKKIDQLKPYW